MGMRRRNRGSRAGTRRGELFPREIAQADPSGFSLRTTGRGAGKVARNVFSVGFAPDAGRGAEVAVDPSQPFHTQMQDFNRQNAHLLGSRAASMIQGGWVNEHGSLVQDVSVALPRTAGGIEAAMQIGAQSSQDSIGNAGHKSFVGVIPVKTDLYPGTTDWHDTEGIDPKVESLGVQQSGRERVKITPSRKEMASVDASEVAKNMKLKD